MTGGSKFCSEAIVIKQIKDDSDLNLGGDNGLELCVFESYQGRGISELGERWNNKLDMIGKKEGGILNQMPER